MHRTLLTAGLLAVLGGSGCLSRQLATDGIGLRQAILDIYTEQVMDNLIRARTNMPFVQLKYSTIQANDVQDVSLQETIDHSISTARNLVTGAATRTILNDFKTVGNGDLKRTMNFTCDPITDQNDIYRKYLAFANDPGLFMSSETKPACPVHIMRKCGKCYYWVPMEAGPAFLNLCLQTTFMRGQDAVAVPAAVVVKVADIVNATPVTGRHIMNATLVFDRPVPNGPAALYVDLADGRSFRLNLWPISQDPQGKHLDLGQPTNHLDAQWSTAADDHAPSITEMKGRSARFYSSDFPPEPGPAPPNLQEINNNLNTIRTQTAPQTFMSP